MANLNIPKVPRAFPVFCQKVLPLTFDNSLSYLEFLAHVNAKLNETIDALNNYGVYIEQVYQIINDNFEQLKIDLEKEITDNKAELLEAIDGLRDDLTAEINELNGRVTTLENEAGEISVTPEITNTVSYTTAIETSVCDIYYQNKNSDIFHPLESDTNVVLWLSGTSAEEIGERSFLFMFHALDEYPALTIPAGFNLESTANTEDEYATIKIYSRATIPGEDFNAGLTEYSETEITVEGGTTAATVTASEKVPAVNCLYVSNTFILSWMRHGGFSATAPETFGTLYSRKTGENVYPRIKIDSTLRYDSNGRLGAIIPFEIITESEWEQITPNPNKIYLVRGLTGDVNMYVGNMRLAAAYAVGDNQATLQTAESAVVGNFEIMED